VEVEVVIVVVAVLMVLVSNAVVSTVVVGVVTIHEHPSEINELANVSKTIVVSTIQYKLWILTCRNGNATFFNKNCSFYFLNLPTPHGWCINCSRCGSRPVEGQCWMEEGTNNVLEVSTVLKCS
jgi:hypothetical protein